MPTRRVPVHVPVYLFSLLANGDDAWSQLHKRLQEKDTTVVMVGDSQHIGPATRMAAELKLPFSLIADDSGALRQLLKIGCSASSCSRYAVVLLDRKGAVRYCQDVSNPGTTLNAIELMAATENLGS